MFKTLKKTRIAAYTFIELMAALLIISILIVASIPLFSGYTEGGKIDELKANLLKAASSQEKFFSNTGKFAATAEAGTPLMKDYDFPTPPNSKMKLFTGVIIRESIGMSYWVAGNYDINSSISDTYNECWIYFGSVLGTGGSDNFVRLHHERTNQTIDIATCPYCPALDTICK